jgi:trk system potassium uptake protein TrkA
MYVVIVGGGKVGFYLARSLVADGAEVLVIEKDPNKCDRIRAEIPGALSFCGDGCEMSVLEQSGTRRADVVAAVTGDDEDNLVICQIAKGRFGVGRTIARINNPRNEAIFGRLGIDVTVSSTSIIQAQLEQQIPTASLVHLLTLHGEGIEIVELHLQPGSPASGRTIQELGLPDDSLICIVIRKNHAMVPSGSTRLEAGDQLVAVVSVDHERLLRQILTGQRA